MLEKLQSKKFWPEYLQGAVFVGLFLLLLFGPSRYRSSAYLPTQYFPVSDFFVSLTSLLWPIKFQLSHLELAIHEDFVTGIFLLVSSFLLQFAIGLLVCSPYLLWRTGRRQASIFILFFLLSLLITGALALTFD